MQARLLIAVSARLPAASDTWTPQTGLSFARGSGGRKGGPTRAPPARSSPGPGARDGVLRSVCWIPRAADSAHDAVQWRAGH